MLELAEGGGMRMDIEEFTIEEISEQEGSVFPARHLMQTVT